MQNKLEHSIWRSRVRTFLIQNQSFGPFVLAVIISILLHVYLISTFWDVLFNQQADKDSVSIIEAQLIAPKPLKKDEIKPVLDAPLKKSRPPKPQKITPVAPIPVPEPPYNPEKNNAPERISEHAYTEESVLAPAPEAQLENIPATPDAQEEQAALNNTPAYKYVETHFDVFTDAESKANRTPAGTAEMVYQTLEDGTHYQIKNTMSPKGLASFIIPDLLQTSEGAISDQGLQPHAYLYQFGTKKNKTYRANFDWAAHTLILENAKGTQTLELLDGTQDLLSFMYQFMYAPPLNEMHIKLTNGKKLSILDYNFEGEEVLETKLGKINTVHLSHDAVEREEKTEIWLAVDYRYLPVKIRKMEKKDKVYEMLINTIKTDLGSLTTPSVNADTPAE